MTHPPTQAGSMLDRITMEFARRDDCLDLMVPSDLRQLLGIIHGQAAEIERLKALLPKRCDGKEQEAFEVWAKAHSMDLTCHPIHYLFLNARTGSARDGWGAALEYVSRTMQPSPPPSTQDGHDNKEGV